MQPSARSTSRLGQRAVLAERDLRGHAAGAGHVERLDGFVTGAGDVPLIERVFQRGGVHGGHVGVQHAGALELAEDRHDAARAVHVFDVVLVGIGRDLAQLRHDARQAVDVVHREVALALPARRPANAGWCWSSRPSRCRGVIAFSKRLEAPPRAAGRRVVLLVVAAGEFDDAAPGLARRGARGRRGWPAPCRCRAARGRALR